MRKWRSSEGDPTGGEGQVPEQTQPWAERTVEMPPDAFEAPPRNEFRRGVAPVTVPAPRTEAFPAVGGAPAATGWPEAPPTPVGPRGMPLSYHLERLREGGRFSAIGALFAFVCWGIWAISTRGSLGGPVLVFLLTLLVAVGLFGLARLLGLVILERQLHRVRRSARGAHLVAGIFLVGVGFSYLRQTEWVMSVWNWFAGIF
jgi:hypothetical protein